MLETEYHLGACSCAATQSTEACLLPECAIGKSYTEYTSCPNTGRRTTSTCLGCRITGPEFSNMVRYRDDPSKWCYHISAYEVEPRANCHAAGFHMFQLRNIRTSQRSQIEPRQCRSECLSTSCSIRWHVRPKDGLRTGSAHVPYTWPGRILLSIYHERKLSLMARRPDLDVRPQGAPIVLFQSFDFPLLLKAIQRDRSRSSSQTVYDRSSPSLVSAMLTQSVQSRT